MSAQTRQKCQEIVLKIVELCGRRRLGNPADKEVPAVAFYQDWGGMSMTVETPDTHVHVGSNYTSTFEDLVDELHEFLDEQASKQY